MAKQEMEIPRPDLDAEARTAWELGHGLEPEEPKPERPRGEDGKFLKAEQEKAPAEEAATEPAEEPEAEATKEEARAEEPEKEDKPEKSEKDWAKEYEARWKRSEDRARKAESRAQEAEKSVETLKAELFEELERLRNPPPDPDLDPEAAARYEAEQRIKKLEAQIEQKSQPASTGTIDESVIIEVNDWVASHEDPNPEEFQSAFQHLHSALKQQYLDAGESEEQAEALVMAVGYQEAQRLKATGGNWTQYVRYHAKQRGWNATQEEQAEGKSTVSDQVAKDLKDVASGRKTARSAGRAPAAKGGELTLESISKIQDREERQRLFTQLVESKKRGIAFPVAKK